MAKKQRQLVVEQEGPVMGSDPLDGVENVLSPYFSSPSGQQPEPRRIATRVPRGRKARVPVEAPTYRIISISLYHDDIERIDDYVEQLKKSGHPKANRSSLIRFAIDTVDLSKMPKSY